MPPDPARSSDALVSVVTISYNQGEFLARAIDSVLSQAPVRVQYIVCDPGSSDDSRAIIDSYGPRIAERVYEHDKGPADGLNSGFARATGDIFAYLNSDDTFLPGAFARVARHFAKHPEVDVVVGHALVTDRDDSVLRRVWSDHYDPGMVAYGVTSHVQPSTFMRAQAFRRTRGFNPDNRIAWDGELLLDLYTSGARIAIIDAFLSTYRLHATSLTNRGHGSADARHFLDRRFAALMGRERRPYDTLFDFTRRVRARLSDPKVPLERYLRGPLHRRGVD